MGREIKRVPMDFDWALDKVWESYLLPPNLHEQDCAHCEGRGYSGVARALMDQWYGYVPFDPASTGSTPYTIDTPEVREFAERNVARSPEFYGFGERVIRQEARRLANLFNSQWMHHLAQEDVDVLIAEGRLLDFTHTWDKEKRWQPIEPAPTVTAEQVNRWSILGFGHDAINCGIVVHDRCKALGVSDECDVCQGHGTTETYPGQRAEAEAWEPTQPPIGDGWQLWETVTEGSPISPVFATPEELARWMVDGSSKWDMPSDYDAALNFVRAGWAPSLVVANGVLTDGVTFVGQEHD